MENSMDYKDSKHVLNRQINYTIIRRLWKYIKGSVESDDPRDNLYSVFPFTRNSYTLLVSGNIDQIPKINKTRRRKLEETGVSIDVFTGDIELTLSNIKTSDWENYFKHRYPDEYSNHSTLDRDDTLRKMNYKLINEFKTIRKYSHDSNFFKLYYFISNGKKYDGDEARYVIRDCMEAFSKITFDQWNLFTADQLGEWNNAIEQQLDMVKTLRSYKNYENKNSR